MTTEEELQVRAYLREAHEVLYFDEGRGFDDEEYSAGIDEAIKRLSLACKVLVRSKS